MIWVALISFVLGAIFGGTVVARTTAPIWRRSMKDIERRFADSLAELRSEHQAHLADRAVGHAPPRIVDVELVEESSR